MLSVLDARFGWAMSMFCLGTLDAVAFALDDSRRHCESCQH